MLVVVWQSVLQTVNASWRIIIKESIVSYVFFFIGRAAVPSTPGAGADAQRNASSVLKLYLSLVANISSGSLFLRWEAVVKNVLLWPAVFEGGIAKAAVWRYVDALVALRTTGGGGNMLLSSDGASPWYIRWYTVSAPTCLLCASGCLAVLPREASGIAIVLTALLWMASSLSSDVSIQMRHPGSHHALVDHSPLVWVQAR